MLMSVLMLMALLGITYALAVRGFFPPVQTCVADPNDPGTC